MIGLETAAAAAGKAVAEKAGREWLIARAQLEGRGKDLSELMVISFPDRFVRRKIDRQLAGIADSVEKRLCGLISNEYRGMSSNDRAAVILEVASTLQEADLSDKEIFASDADSASLARRIGFTRPRRLADLGDAGMHLYDILLIDCCDCLVRIIRQLPEFTPRAVGEMLPRLSAIADQVSAALDRLPVRTLDAPQGAQDDNAFERRYLEHLSDTFDEVELFGVRVVNYRPRATLSVAYISLNVTAGNGSGPMQPARSERLRFADLTGDREHIQTAMRAETALTRWPRLLLRGQAGSGKSTLLGWLAVTAARGGLPDDMTGWNKRVPFLIKLRSYADRDLPEPDDFIVGPLRGLAPKGWVHRVLRADRGVLLVDGVDELPAAGRAGVRQWLRALLAAYPGTRVIVTSRPAAADDRWLTAEGFSAVMLEPMTPAHLRQLVRQWHAAAQHADSLPCAATELPRYEGALLARLEGAPHLRLLAATPLLAALICALNLDRSTHLPRDRMGLYSAALELLLERRDAEREIPVHRRIALEPEQKIRILQELAWQLTVFGRAEMARTTALHRVAEKLATMPRVTASPAEVLDYLLQRSGVIREPVPGRIDFVHRTFQEYLAARQAADNADIEPLVARAHLDQWQETIIMAAGHANAPLRRELFASLLTRVDAEPRRSHRLRLLVAACLETAPDIPGDLRWRVDQCIESLIPPRNSAEARPLSQAGEEIVRRLPDTLTDLTTAEAIATVRTAWMINGPEALRKLACYASDTRIKVQDELLAGWGYFEPEEYARRVLADAPLHRGRVDAESTEVLAAMPMLHKLRQLRVFLPKGVSLNSLAGVPALETVFVKGITLDSLAPLSEHKQLRTVHLFEIDGVFNDLSPLLGLTRMVELYLYPTRPIPDISMVARLPKLKYLGISGLENIEDFSPIARQDSLQGLWLFGCPGLADIGAIRSLARLRSLSLRGSQLGPDGLNEIVRTFPQLDFLQLLECDWLTDLSPLVQLPLKGLILGRTRRIASLDAIRGLSQLRQLWLVGLPIRELTPISELKRLRWLEIKDCPGVVELTSLATLPRLRHLSLQGAAEDLDLSPLARARNLAIVLREGQRVSGAERLHKTTWIEWRQDGWQP